MITNESKINLDEVYKDLTDNSLIRTSKVNKLFSTFANLLGTKVSFLPRVHSAFKKLIK